MKVSAKRIHVYADWAGDGRPVKMGWLDVNCVRGKEMFSFEFDPDWLKTKNECILDPDLYFFAGRQYPGAGKANFGVFLDSSPDRWGRQLMRRREAILARRERRAVRRLLESDFLLGVHDATRMGALRFKLDDSGGFARADSELPAPPWASLRELESACLHIEDESDDGGESDKWLLMLLAPGSSLGGARPKANVLHNDGSLWIAKFPRTADSFNMGAWEMLTHRLAERAGLKVPETRLEMLSRKGGTFMSRRFDRQGGARIHFASAMTLLGRMDGENHEGGCSYLDLAQFIVRHGANPADDLEELWRRIVFNIAVSNTDDHMRNHGFLLTRKGWTLSPAYDLNPNPVGAGLSMNVSDDDNSLDLDLAMSVAPLFRLSSARADKILRMVRRAVGDWKEMAKALKISRAEIERMSPAFLVD